jgi:hypothetical protein
MKTTKQKIVMGLCGMAALVGLVFAGNQLSSAPLFNLDADEIYHKMLFDATTNKVSALNTFEQKTTMMVSSTTTGPFVYATRDDSYKNETVILDSTTTLITVLSYQSGSTYLVQIRFRVFAHNIGKTAAKFSLTASATDPTLVKPTSWGAHLYFSTSGALTPDPFPTTAVDLTSDTEVESDSNQISNAVEFNLSFAASQSFALNLESCNVSWYC